MSAVWSAVVYDDVVAITFRIVLFLVIVDELTTFLFHYARTTAAKVFLLYAFPPLPRPKQAMKIRGKTMMTCGGVSHEDIQDKPIRDLPKTCMSSRDVRRE